MSASAAAVMWIRWRLTPPGITSKHIAVPIWVSFRSLWEVHSITADPWGPQRTMALLPASHPKRRASHLTLAWLTIGGN